MFTAKIAQTPAEREQVLNLIQETYGAAYAGSNYRESISGAYFDQIAVESIMLVGAGRLVGTISMMHNRQNQALPTPSEFLLGYQRPAHLPQNVVEVGRLAKATQTGLAAADEMRVLPILIWQVSRRLLERRVEGFVATVQPQLFQKFVRLGLPLEVLETGCPSINADGFGAYTNSQVTYFYCSLAKAAEGLSQWDGLLPQRPTTRPLTRPTAVPLAA